MGCAPSKKSDREAFKPPTRPTSGVPSSSPTSNQASPSPNKNTTMNMANHSNPLNDPTTRRKSNSNPQLDDEALTKDRPKSANTGKNKENEKAFSKYMATSLVKPKGHRVRIDPSLKSNPVHLIVPPTLLLVTKIKTVETCEWGKVHPSMFPNGFKGCKVDKEGWCLLTDNTHANTPLIYWRLAD